ncbi:MAG: ThiF family adenylyltransferase [Hyphomonas sp.]|uniref:ThiF family adenylyltransferase n=1 Tax=Hyphomonas sp. TaxID=87 RepID=UPI003266E215|tara:strand:+ start:6461 stop:7849 length:1389 start_codon:yes stop_codon:yes gene_type:complete
MTDLTLAMGAADHAALKAHLFPGDGLEAAAILICGRAGDKAQRLCVSSVIPISHNDCKRRTPTRIDWPGEYLDQAIEAADAMNGSILLTHSHPGGFLGFSHFDDDSDALTIPSLVHGSADEAVRHGSAVMVPDGSMIARIYNEHMAPQAISRVWRLGHNMKDIARQNTAPVLPFSSSMTKVVNTMTACVVGASGTGSPTIEMLARMGFGRMVIIEFDRMELRNLNRILNSTVDDAKAGALKVDVMERGAQSHRPDIQIIKVPTSIDQEGAIIAASGADVLFCCVDTMEGRLYCDLIAESCLIPLIDIGVMIPTRTAEDGSEIADVVARIDYIQPGGATLRDRGEITGEGLAAEDLRRTDPETYARQLDEGYIRGVVEEAPSVIALNMHAASLGVMELIARLFPYRHDSNGSHDRIFLSLAAMETDFEQSEQPRNNPLSIFGQGLKYPLLGMPSLTDKRRGTA